MTRNEDVQAAGATGEGRWGILAVLLLVLVLLAVLVVLAFLVPWPQDEPADGDDALVDGSPREAAASPKLIGARRPRDQPQGERAVARTTDAPPSEAPELAVTSRRVVIEGQVVDERGTPVEGAHIDARHLLTSNADWLEEGWTATGPTNEQGIFQYVQHVLVGKTYEVTFEAHHEGRLATVTVESPLPSRVTLELRPRLAIEGRVLDVEGEPVAGLQEEVFLLQDPFRPALTDDTLFGDDSEFWIPVTDPGPYVLVFSGRGAPSPVIVTAPTGSLQIASPRGAVLSGRLVGESLSDFVVTWIPRRDLHPLHHDVRTAVLDGAAFRFEDLPRTEGLLYVHSEKDPRCALVRGIVLPEDDVEVRLTPGETLRGRVAGWGNRSGPDLHIGALWEGLTRWSLVGRDGTFVLTGLPPGRYDLCWSRGRHKGAFSRHTSVDPRTGPFTLPAPR